MIIRNLDEAIKTRLRVRAAIKGRSMEDEARDILLSALLIETPHPASLGQSIHERFVALGGIDLPDTQREPSREPIGSDE